MSRAVKRTRPRRSPVGLRLESLERRQVMSTFTVTTVADAGPGSLRQAILDDNVGSGSGTGAIVFDISGNGVQTIVLASPLPTIVNPTNLDATTQPGYTNHPLVELDGANILDPATSSPVPNVTGLTLTGGSSTVKGLIINRFTGGGIVATRDGNVIAADYIGTDSGGRRSLGNGANGVALSGRNNTIGAVGSSGIDIIAVPNIISGNGAAGLYLGGSGGSLPANNSVLGNRIGTDGSGTLDLGNAGPGINVESSDNTIGNSSYNLIAFNGGAGVQVGSSIYQSNVIGNRIEGNSLYSNVGLGIDLGGDGVTRFGSPGFGPNNLIGFPTLTSAYSAGGETRVEGTLAGLPNSAYTVDFYSSPQPNRSGYGEGKTYLGAVSYLTDASGQAILDTTQLTSAVVPGQYLSATTTDSTGNTSEFARSLVVASRAESNLSVFALGGNPAVQAGQAQTYYFNVQNFGPLRATGVTFTDLLPAGAQFLTGTVGQGTLTESGGRVVATIGTLASNAGIQVSLTYIVPSPGYTKTSASVTAEQADPSPSNNTITQNIQVAPAAPVDLSLYGVASPYPVQVGQPITFVFVVTNGGGNPATGVTFADALPANLAVDSAISSQGATSVVGNNVVAALGNLDAGTNATVTIVARPISTGPINNFATVRANEPDPNSINNSATAYAYAIPAPMTDVAVAITAAPQPATVGQPFAYAVLVGNPGTAPASGVVLTDVLPDAATIASIKPSQGTYTLVGNVLTVNFGSLAVGALAEVTVSLIPGAPGVIINRASVVSDQPDFHIANNFDALATGVVGQPIVPAIIDQKLTVVGNKITRAILTFNEALDSNSASMIANYLVEDLGSKGSTSAKGPKVPIISATYDAVSRSITLVFGKPLSLGRFYKIVVNGPGSPGLVDPAGNVLDGERNGLQNGIYTSLIGRGTTTRPISLQIGVPRPKPVPHAAPVAKHHHH